MDSIAHANDKLQLRKMLQIKQRLMFNSVQKP